VGLTFAAKHEAKNEVRRVWPFALLGATPLLGTTYFSPLGGVALLACSALVVWIAKCLRWLLVPEVRSVPKAVVGLIAGISLLDGFICAANGSLVLMSCCVVCFALTRLAQRVVPGT
jgi:4-hydroxybenzoate polyprenyltransferase